MSQRVNIALDVAGALDYLHHHGQVPIVHCDLKPSNVLLDSGMVAHVADFGLTRFIRKMVSNSTEESSTSIGIKAPLDTSLQVPFFATVSLDTYFIKKKNSLLNLFLLLRYF